MSTSSQKFLARNRAPRVRIAYGVDLYGARREVQLPFVVGVLADLAGLPQEPLAPLAERKFLDIDIDNFDSRLASIGPRVLFDLPDGPDVPADTAGLHVDLNFERLSDFEPAAVVARVPPLRTSLARRSHLVNLLTYVDGKLGAEALLLRVLHDRPLLEALAGGSRGEGTGAALDPSLSFTGGPLVTELLQREFRPRSEQALLALQEALCAFATAALADSGPPGADAVVTLQRWVSALDTRLSRQLRAILHHPGFQQLESAWRGLHHLVANTETGDTLKIRCMSVSKAELAKTLRRHKGTAWDQSPLFKRIYEDEFGSFGGQPYGCLIGDYHFDNGMADVETLGELGKICAAAHTPFLAGAALALINAAPTPEGGAFGRTVVGHHVTPEFAAWRALQHAEESRYLFLALPRFLARLPHGRATRPLPEFDFDEVGPEPRHADHVWCNSAYAMAVCVTRAYALYGWCARIEGIESGGAVEGLPAYPVPAGRIGPATMGPVELAINDRTESELARAGFIPLIHRPGADYSAFVSTPPIHQRGAEGGAGSTADALLSSRLPYLLACCHFAQALKCLVRDQVDAAKDSRSLERWLQQWIDGYVDDAAGGSEALRARRPLASAEVQVADVEGNPGYYTARFFLRPAYQLPEVPTSVRMVSRLPSVKASQ